MEIFICLWYFRKLAAIDMDERYPRRKAMIDVFVVKTGAQRGYSFTRREIYEFYLDFLEIYSVFEAFPNL